MRKKITIKGAVAIALVVGLLVGAVGYFSKGFENMNAKDWVLERNPDNIFSYETETFDNKNGVKKEVDSSGVVTVKGYVADTVTYKLETITLEAGTYTLSTGDGNSSTNKIALYGELPDGSKWYADDTDTMTKEFAEDTEITFYVAVYADGKNVDCTIKPILNEGDEAIDFFVKRSAKESK